MPRSRTPSNPTTPTTPTTPKHNYNDPTVYYVSRDFFAAKSDQLSVFVDDELEIIEELPGGTWTRVKERDSKQTGLIPTEILESGPERLAKENKTSNQDTIRFMSCKPNESGTAAARRKNKRKTVSFCESIPDVIHYPADDTNDHSIFPFTLSDEVVDSIAHTDAYEDQVTDDSEATVAGPTVEPEKKGFLSKLFEKKPKGTSDSQTKKILSTLQTFEQYPDHLIRVYTGNFDSILHAYKSFIVDESLTFAEFTHMVLCTFQLEMDSFNYEINLVNHLTAEVVPLDTDFTIEQVIEISKREGLNFSAQMPKELRKAQKSALKRLWKRKDGNDPVVTRDKSSDYVTPFKFVLNRIYTPADNVPVYVHVSLAYTSGPEHNSADLLISSLFSNEQTEEKKTKKKKWFKSILGKNSSNDSTSSSSSFKQQVHRVLAMTHDPLHILIHNLLESLQVPSTLPGIAFEAFLPAIHDAIELPLPMNMPVGDVMRIRPKLDQAEQVIIVRPVIIEE